MDLNTYLQETLESHPSAHDCQKSSTVPGAEWPLETLRVPSIGVCAG